MTEETATAVPTMDDSQKIEFLMRQRRALTIKNAVNDGKDQLIAAEQELTDYVNKFVASTGFKTEGYFFNIDTLAIEPVKK